MFVIKHKKIFFSISAALVVLSFVFMGIFGLQTSIDFAGGSILEVSYTDTIPEQVDVEEIIAEAGVESVSVRRTGDNGFVLRSEFLSEETRVAVLGALDFDDTHAFVEERFSSIGPTIGEELRRKAFYAIAFVVIMIILYVAFAFRQVSKPVSSWKYGAVAIVALLHDIIIPTGVFALLGRFAGAEVGVLFVMALLAILGFSVNDTIVVFDRIRENLRLNQENNRHEPFADVVGTSLGQTFTRSINTSITTLVVLLALFFIGGSTIHNFVLTLIVGVLAGTYSSIFLASPLLVVLGQSSKKK